MEHAQHSSLGIPLALEPFQHMHHGDLCVTLTLQNSRQLRSELQNRGHCFPFRTSLGHHCKRRSSTRRSTSL